MSVRQWKRVITFTVLTTIILLLVLTVIFFTSSCQYSSLIDDGKLVDLTEYGDMDSQELSGIFKYLSSLESDVSQSYHNLYPDLYAENDFNFVDSKTKTCYFTFDDGPDPEKTAAILDILKEYNIKATFFVVYDTSDSAASLYRRIVDEGHTIGIHTASHDYEYVYSSVEVFLENFEKTASYVEEVTGVKPNIFRFPGGSINIYNKSNYREFIAEMVRRGYVYYDWNVTGSDDTDNSSDEITKTVLAQSSNKNNIILLLHDGSGYDATVSALPEIIIGLEKQGFSFAALDNKVTPYCFGY